MKKVLLISMILSGCVQCPVKREVQFKTVIDTCPCAGWLICKCDPKTGSYSYFDGCNTVSCSVDGQCMKTAAYCPPKDWRFRE